MIKILLYTKNKINKSKINEILESKDFTLQVEKTFNNLPSRLEDTSIIILDIALKDEGDDIPIKNIIKAADKYDINKFIILNPDQANYLFESEIKFDDFVFNTRLEEELFLRIKAILLKTDLFSPKNSIIVDRLILNLDKYELSINGKPVELTFKELELFKILLQNQNKVFTRNKLLSTVWEYDFYGGSRTVDVHMRRLRSKIPSPYNLMLKTVRNVGYMFSPQI
ncbi:MAG: response regulator transcription factor [Actinomycetia bacterium]|nr:response regulator transcription factor [Actinomycetes bacterium]